MTRPVPKTEAGKGLADGEKTDGLTDLIVAIEDEAIGLVLRSAMRMIDKAPWLTARQVIVAHVDELLATRMRPGERPADDVDYSNPMAEGFDPKAAQEAGW